MSWFASRRSKIEHHQRSTLARHHHHHRVQGDKTWTSTAIAREKWLENLFHEQEVLLGDSVKRGVFSRLPKTSLLTLSLITLFIHFLANRTALLPIQLVGQTGATMTAALSMTTGLLMSYRSSSALAKWGKGKAVWSGVKAEIRDVLRQLSTCHPAKPVEPINVLKGGSTAHLRRQEQARALDDKAGELACLFIAFGFALHHHLTESRPLIQRAPLCDILPSGYVESKSRTRNRVRFAGGEGKEETSQTSEESSSSSEESGSGSKSATSLASDEDSEENVLVNGDVVKPDENRPIELKKLIGRANVGTGRASRKRERDAQLKQLNVAPSSPSLTTDYHTYVIEHQPGQTSQRGNGPSSHLARSPSDKSSGSPTGSPTTTTRSSLSRTVPSNLPLDILRMIESYVNSLHLAYQIDTELAKKSIEDPLSRLPYQLGHSIPQSEKLHKSLRTLSKFLGEAEMLSEDPPPLSLSIHLNHLVMLYLLAIPAQVMPILGRYSVFVVLIAGWALLGVEALCREVGTVFGSSENHLPTRTYAVQMLNEALDTCPLFLESYRGRLEERLYLGRGHSQSDKEKDADTAGSAKAVHRAREEEMLKSLDRRRRDEWIPDFRFERWGEESSLTPSSSDSSWAKPVPQGTL